MLNPQSHNLYGFGKKPGLVVAVTKAFQRIADTPEEAVHALGELEYYRNRRGLFASNEAYISASRHDAGMLLSTYIYIENQLSL